MSGNRELAGRAPTSPHSPVRLCVLSVSPPICLTSQKIGKLLQIDRIAKMMNTYKVDFRAEVLERLDSSAKRMDEVEKKIKETHAKVHK